MINANSNQIILQIQPHLPLSNILLPVYSDCLTQTIKYSIQQDIIIVDILWHYSQKCLIICSSSQVLCKSIVILMDNVDSKISCSYDNYEIFQESRNCYKFLGLSFDKLEQTIFRIRMLCFVYVKNQTSVVYIAIYCYLIMASSQDIDIRDGKNRLLTHIILIVFFQSTLFVASALITYAVLTQNWRLGLFLACVSVLQRFLKRSQWVIDWTNKYIQPLTYFRRWRRIYEEQIPEDEADMYCMHPHSVFSYCVAANMNADNSKTSQMVGLASRFILAIPFIGAQLRLWGVQSVNAKNIIGLMEKRKQVLVLPGGFQQATLTTPNQLRVFIKNRKGFIKYALKYNYTIRPVLVYNEHKAFWTFDYFKSFRLALNKLKLPGVIFGGGFLWLYIPLNMEIINIVGRGIKRKPQNVGKEVNTQQIDEIHEQYMKEITRMHDKHRSQHGEAPLVFY